MPSLPLPPARRRTAARAMLAASAAAAMLTVAACGGQSASTEPGATIEVEDNNGTQTVPPPPTSVVATDNRTCETLADWGVALYAGAVSLRRSTIHYTAGDSIGDIGCHREPDLEAVVAAEPDLIVNGQRYSQYHDDFVDLAPDAAIPELDPREGEPFDAELARQVTVLGEVFDKQTEAEQLVEDLQSAIDRATEAYDGQSTVMAVI